MSLENTFDFYRIIYEIVKGKNEKYITITDYSWLCKL